jgi:hypothetical protein
MATLEQRIAEIEARLGPAPMAVPPMTIGELVDVPVPGSAIAAAWAQEVSARVVQRFANKAALNAYAAGNGAFAVTLDNGVLWRRLTGGWSQVTPWTAQAAGRETDPGGIGNANTGAIELSRVDIPADPGLRVADVSCSVRVEMSGGSSTYVGLYVDGAAAGQFAMQSNANWNAVLRATVPLAAGVGHPVTVVIGHDGPTWATAHTWPDQFLNRLDVIVVPRGW